MTQLVLGLISISRRQRDHLGIGVGDRNRVAGQVVGGDGAVAVGVDHGGAAVHCVVFVAADMAVGVYALNNIAGIVVAVGAGVAVDVGFAGHAVGLVVDAGDKSAGIEGAVRFFVVGVDLFGFAIGVIYGLGNIAQGVGDAGDAVEGVVLVASGEVDQGRVGGGSSARQCFCGSSSEVVVGVAAAHAAAVGAGNGDGKPPRQ